MAIGLAHGSPIATREVALPDLERARRLVTDLLARGVPMTDLTVVYKGGPERHPFQERSGTRRFAGSWRGAAVGLLIGAGFLSLNLGRLRRVIPAIPRVLPTRGRRVIVGAIGGVVVGLVVGGGTGALVPRHRAHLDHPDDKAPAAVVRISTRAVDQPTIDHLVMEASRFPAPRTDEANSTIRIDATKAHES